jgi:hypothetical protein
MLQTILNENSAVLPLRTILALLTFSLPTVGKHSRSVTTINSSMYLE